MYLSCSLGAPFQPRRNVIAWTLPIFGDLQLAEQTSWVGRNCLICEQRGDGLTQPPRHIAS